MLYDFSLAAYTALTFHFIRWWREYCVLAAALGFVAVLYCFFIAPPRHFPVSTIVTIADGDSLDTVATKFRAAGLISSPLVFDVIARATGTSNILSAGPYRFLKPANVVSVWWAVSHGEFGLPPAKITIPEGMNNIEVAARVHDGLPGIAEVDFLQAANGEQGYLFPDTYRFLANATAEAVIRQMKTTFDTRIASIEAAVSASGRSLHDLVIMASLLEGETKTPEDRRIVSGILWRRISIGMALQVDASPDTYQHQGLPAAPINNPGLDAILAAAEPTKTSYLYYLTGDDGFMHYAKTFAEHQANLTKYLK